MLLDEEQAMETIVRAAEELDPGHELRPVLLGAIGESLDWAGSGDSGSAEHRDAVVALLERVPAEADPKLADEMAMTDLSDRPPGPRSPTRAGRPFPR